MQPLALICTKSQLLGFLSCYFHFLFTTGPTKSTVICSEGSQVKHYPVAGLVPDSLSEHVALAISHAWVPPKTAD